MKFKSKVFKLGNGFAVYIPREVFMALEENKVYTFEVETEEKEQTIYTDKTEFTNKPPKGKLVFNIKKGINEWQ